MRCSSTALSLALAAVAQALLDKPALWGDLNFLGDVINGQLPTTTLAMSKWPAGQLARGCRETLVADGKNPNNFQQYSLFMGDCAQEWHVCQENGAKQSIESVFWAYARVPVRMRQWTNNIIHYASGSGAYMLAYNVVLRNDAASTGTMMHEVMHSVDFGDGLYSMNSRKQEWADAYNRDSAVPDNYARTDLIEDLAQFPNLIIYDRFTNGRLKNYGDISRLGNQLQKVSDQADWAGTYGGQIFSLPGSGVTCNRRWNKDPSVRADNGQPVKRDGEVAEFEQPGPPEGFKFDPTNTTIEVVPIPQGRGMVQTPTNCTFQLSPVVL